MLGPFLTYDDEPHLELLLSAVRAAHIDVQPAPERRSGFWFRRGWGLIHGTPSQDGSQSNLCFGFGHPFNPLLWPADRRLLREIKRVFLVHGSQHFILPTVP